VAGDEVDDAQGDEFLVGAGDGLLVDAEGAGELGSVGEFAMSAGVAALDGVDDGVGGFDPLAGVVAVSADGNHEVPFSRGRRGAAPGGLAF
jgi:hypothetical protein